MFVVLTITDEDLLVDRGFTVRSVTGNLIKSVRMLYDTVFDIDHASLDTTEKLVDVGKTNFVSHVWFGL